MDSVQLYDTEYYEIHNKMDDEHSEVWFDSVRIDRYHLNCALQ